MRAVPVTDREGLKCITSSAGRKNFPVLRRVTAIGWLQGRHSGKLFKGEALEGMQWVDNEMALDVLQVCFTNPA